MTRRAGFLVAAFIVAVASGIWLTRFTLLPSLRLEAPHRAQPQPAALGRPAHTAIAVSPAPVTQPPPNPIPISPPPRPAPAGYWFRGVVLTPERQPVSAFTIQRFRGFSPLAEPDEERTFQEPSGEFEWRSSAAGAIDLVVKAAGFTESLVPQVELVPASQDPGRMEILLVPEGRIRGQVVNEVGKPVAGAEVELGMYASEVDLLGAPEKDQAAVDDYLDAANPNPHQRTDESGRFELSGLPQGTYQLVATHSDYFPAMQEVVLRPGSVLEGLRLTLHDHGATLLVHVFQGADRPVAGAALHLDETPIHGVTDAQGVWREEELPPGVYRVILSMDAPGEPTHHSEHWADAVAVVGKTTDVAFRLARGVVVVGEVKRGGQPIAGADVAAGLMSPEAAGEASAASPPTYANASAKTDGVGRFALGELPPGEYQLTVTQGEWFSKLRCTLAETDDQRSLHIDLGALTAEGLVRDGSTGQPILGAAVSLLPLQLEGDERGDDDFFVASTQQEVLSDDAGRYRIDGIAPGQYAIDASAPRYGRLISRVVSAAEPALRYDITLWPRGQLILAVVNAQRLPVYRARVQLATIEDSDNSLVAMTNPQGLVQWEDLAPGSYELLVDLEQGGGVPYRNMVDLKSGDIRRLEVIMEASSPASKL